MARIFTPLLTHVFWIVIASILLVSMVTVDADDDSDDDDSDEETGDTSLEDSATPPPRRVQPKSLYRFCEENLRFCCHPNNRDMNMNTRPVCGVVVETNWAHVFLSQCELLYLRCMYKHVRSLRILKRRRAHPMCKFGKLFNHQNDITNKYPA